MDSQDARPRAPGTGLAIASLVLGIVATLSSFILIGALFGLFGLLTGIAVVARRLDARAMAWWGVALSALGIVASVGFGWFYYDYIQGRAAGNSELVAWEGVMAPDLAVTTLGGEQMRLSDLRGKRVLVDFWATWCGPCRQEIPHLNQLYAETSRDDLVMVGISDESHDEIKAFVREQRVRYPTASATDLPSPYDDVSAIPTAFFIDRNGVIQSVVVGYQDLESLRELALADDFAGEPKAAPAEVEAERSS